RAVGTPASTSTCFIHAFEPSRCAPSAPGPNTSLPCARRRSASPSTRTASGPGTNRSASISVGGVTTEPGMPGLPGVTTTSAVRPSATASACSRPPEPTTQTLTEGPLCARAPSRREVQELLAAGADPDERDRHADLLLEEGDVLERRRRQV